MNFKHEGTLPKDTKVKVYVGDKYQNDSVVNIYYYNEDSNKMETIEKEVKVEDGYVVFEIEHCSEYIITRSTLNSNTFNIFIPIAIVEALIIAVLVCTKFMPKKIKNN